MTVEGDWRMGWEGGGRWGRGGGEARKAEAGLMGPLRGWRQESHFQEVNSRPDAATGSPSNDRQPWRPSTQTAETSSLEMQSNSSYTNRLRKAV